MRRLGMAVIIATLVLSLVGCATTSQQQGAMVGTGVGAGLGALIGYAVGGEQGALIGAGIGALAGGLTGWAIARHNETVQMAAAQNQRVEQVSPDGNERIVAEPVGFVEVKGEALVVEETVLVQEAGQTKVENRTQTLEPGKKYRKVQARTYKKDPETKQEIIVADTTQFVPLA